MKTSIRLVVFALLPGLFFVTACSDESKLKDKGQELAQQKIIAEAQEEAKVLSSPWMRQAYQDYVSKNTEVRVLEVEMSGSESAVVKLQIEKINGDLKSNLLGVAGKVPPDGARRFNFSDGASMVQQQLGIKEFKYWAPVERVNFRKGPNGWAAQN
jgi:hypothetical protein